MKNTITAASATLDCMSRPSAMTKMEPSTIRGIELATLMKGLRRSERNRLRPSTTPKTTPSTTPITKPRTVSSNVVTTCSHKGPCAVPCVTQVTSCVQIPEGWPQKKGSTMPTRVVSSQLPMITTSSRMRSVLITMRRRRRAAVADDTPVLSAVVMGALDSLLIALIANQYLVAKIFPDFVIQLDETRLEADFLHFARTRQVDSVDALDGARPGGEDAHAVGQGDGLLQVVGDEDYGGREGGPHLEQFVFHQGARLHVEGAKRLVHQQDLRLVDKGLRQRHSLAHAAGELMRVAVLETGQPDARDPIARALARLSFSLAAEQRAGDDVAEHILPREDRVSLEDIADARVDALHGLAHHLHRTFARPLQAGDETQGGGFATAGRPNHGEELAVGDRQVDVTDRGVGLASWRREPLGDVA